MTIDKENAAGLNQTAGVNSQNNPASTNEKKQEKSPLLEAALEFLTLGAPVFPVQERGKKPKTAHGYKDASRDQDQVGRWWTQSPCANIGIPTGNVSGFWVLDIDGEEGEASLKTLENQHGKLPQSVEVITGGGGRHIYFALPATGKIPNSASTLGKCLDVRGDGGYIVAPPSIHESGRRYEWSVDSADDFVAAPEWLLNLVLPHEKAKTAKPPQDWLSMLRGVSEGSRNDTLSKLAGKLLSCRNLDPRFSLYLLAAWNDARCKPPLPHDEVVKTFYSIAGMEAKKRGLV